MKTMDYRCHKGFLLLIAALICGRAMAARAWEGTVKIPTYVLGAPDPDPPFPLVTPRRVYPYPLLDNVTRLRELKSYHAIFLENRYLRATILPGLGGRVISLYDKVAHREVFYHNHVIKPLPVGVRGAWFSGGLEFNFPDSHSIDTMSPVSYSISNDPDGSADVSLGDMDWVTGMSWEEDLILRPQSARLELHVRLFNGAVLPKLYWYWGVGAIYATKDLQLIFPMREAYTDAGLFNYPVNHGVNWSWYKNAYEGNSLFACGVRRNFFGAYYHNSDYGVVHVADFRNLPGKKIWTWGRDQAGKVWEDALTDSDGPYDEIQTGRTETQFKYEFLQPQRFVSSKEYWYPVQNLHGGFLAARSQLALNVVIPPASTGKPHVTICVYPTVTMADVKIIVKLGTKVIRKFDSISFTPSIAEAFLVPVPSLQSAREQLAISVAGKDGDELMQWSAKEPVDGNPDFSSVSCTLHSPMRASNKMPAQELFDLGLKEQKRYGLEEASAGGEAGIYRLYQQAVHQDPGFVPALLKLAWRDYEGANFKGAEKLLASSDASTNPYVDYTLGLIYRSQGRLPLAANYFWSSFHFGAPLPAAYAELGETLMEERKYKEAIKWLHRAVNHNPMDPLVLTDLAVAFRLADKQKEAIRTIKRVLDIMPLLSFAQAEESRISESSDITNSGTGSTRKCTKPINLPHLHDYLEVAAWYRRLGDLQSSDAVLKSALANSLSSRASPLIYYYLASNEILEGNIAEATRLYQRAAHAPYDYVFPSEIIDAQILAEAIKRNPNDAHAKYFLGNFYFAHGRYTKAAVLWLEAQRQGFRYSVLERNLGVFEQHVKHDLSKAAAYYETAIQLSPNQYRLYASLDDLYMAEGDTIQRKRMFQNAPHHILQHDRIAIRLARLYVQEKHYDEALRLLLNHEFRPGHIVNRRVYLWATIGKGMADLKHGRPQLAVEDFSKAVHYPANLGIGKLYHPEESEPYYWLGQAYKAEGNLKAALNAWNIAVKEGMQKRNSAGYSITGVPKLFAALSELQLGQTRAANQVINRLADLRTETSPSARQLYVAGLAEHFVGHGTQSSLRLQQALRVNPFFWEARLELGLSMK